jgi:T-complex protein 1 subunit theta
MVLKRVVEGSITKVTDCKVAVYAQGFDTSGTETKGTVLIHNAAELESYAKTEENRMEQIVKGVADAGVQVCVTSGRCRQDVSESQHGSAWSVGRL